MDALAAQSVEELLREPQGNWGGHITSFEQYVQMRQKLNSARLVDIDQAESTIDDFPYSPEAKMTYAFKLWEAMVDYTDCLETNNTGKKHFQVERLKAMSEIEMEVLAWELLSAIENAHLGSLGFTIIPEGTDRKPSWRYSSFGSFGARFEAVKEACRQSKSVVYNLTLSPFMIKLAADPEHEITSKKLNKIINDKRAVTKKTQVGQMPVSAIDMPAATATPATVAPAEHISPQPRSAAAGTPQPAQVPHRVQTGRVSKGNQSGKTVSQHAAVKLESSLLPQVSGATLPTEAGPGSANSLVAPMAGPFGLVVPAAGPSGLVASTAGPSNLAGVGQEGQASLGNILETPLHDGEQDASN